MGGIAGGAVTVALARRIGPVPLLLVAAALFEAGVLCLHRLARVYRVDAGAAERAAEDAATAFRPARARSRA